MKKQGPSAIDHFTEMAKSYDEKNRQLAPISDNMHFLIRLILKNAPKQARVLCVGVGTGAEILSLSKAFPEWNFVGVDPSSGMLEVCKDRLMAAGVFDRCELIHGYAHDVSPEEGFDIALSVLVAHFIKSDERLMFYKELTRRLLPGGILINTEISFDMNSQEFPLMMKSWESVQLLMGAPPESIAHLERVMREMLSVISPADTETLLRQSGVKLPVQFFKAFMISGWYGIKSN
jgi:tRNA (cmo5U34)-methyltransferase